MLTCCLVSASYLIGTIVLDYKGADWTGELRETEKPPRYWAFNILCFFLIFITTAMNALFLWFAFWDANRRIYLMRAVSNSLELDLQTKDKITVRMPTLNFLDTESILTWLEARKLVLETGNRF